MTVNTNAAPSAVTDPLAYAEYLISLLPPGPKYNEIGFALLNIAEHFPEDLAKADAEDIARWVSEIDAGTRTDRSIRNDMFRHFVKPAKIMARFGVDAATAEQLITGAQQFGELDRPVNNELLTEGTLVRVRNPAGSDAPDLYFVVVKWRGVELSYEIGDLDRLTELFGGVDAFDTMRTHTQAGYDNQGFVDVGFIDQMLGATETIESTLERETRALGMEDLPSWIAGSDEALALIATAAADEWSQGRLWEELSNTGAFEDRFGAVIGRYQEGNVTVQDAVNQIIADENEMRAALRPFSGDDAETTEVIHEMLNLGWTAGAAAQVLEAGEALVRDPDAFRIANFILGQSGLPLLDEAGYINALNGVGPQETIEALNTANAGRALAESGIDIDNDDLRLLLELVDTSDRLLTADSWREMSQELAFNMIRFNTEIDAEKLGIAEDDLIAAAFGREAPSGKSSGEVMGLLARFERDRRAASEGFEGSTGFLDDQGRLRIQGLGGV